MTQDHYKFEKEILTREYNKNIDSLNLRYLDSIAQFKEKDIIEDEYNRIIVTERKLVFFNENVVIKYSGYEISKNLDFTTLDYNNFVGKPQVFGNNDLYSDNPNLKLVGSLK